MLVGELLGGLPFEEGGLLFKEDELPVGDRLPPAFLGGVRKGTKVPRSSCTDYNKNNVNIMGWVSRFYRNSIF